jgi:mannose-6-phosphate isomerase-like protein (cupin superfamily)
MTFLNVNLGSPVVRARETVTGEFGVVGARFIMVGDASEGRFSFVEHPIVPRGLAAPIHVHTREDEFSFVSEGRWGFQLASDVVYAEPGDLVYKPRDVVAHVLERHQRAGSRPRDHLPVKEILGPTCAALAGRPPGRRLGG